MSHRRVYSQGTIPFSWEDSPGVSKVTPPPSPARDILDRYAIVSADKEIKIPLPPCPKPKAKAKALQRSRSAKGVGYWWEEDPFLAAYKECTKATPRNGKNPPSCEEDKNLGIVGSNSKMKKGKLFTLPCKSSCDVRDDTFVTLSRVPPLPRDHKARVR